LWREKRNVRMKGRKRYTYDIVEAWELKEVGRDKERGKQ
jgi:predicted transcriptional regulator